MALERSSDFCEHAGDKCCTGGLGASRLLLTAVVTAEV